MDNAKLIKAAYNLGLTSRLVIFVINSIDEKIEMSSSLEAKEFLIGVNRNLEKVVKEIAEIAEEDFIGFLD